MDKNKASKILKDLLSGDKVNRSDLDAAQLWASDHLDPNDPEFYLADSLTNYEGILDNLKTLSSQQRKQALQGILGSATSAATGLMAYNLGREGLQAGKELEKEAGADPFLGPTFQADPLLAARSSQAMADIGGAYSGPQAQYLQDQIGQTYAQQMRNAMLGAGGQSSAFLAAGQGAASNRNRAGLQAAAQLEQNRRASQNQMDGLLQQRRAEQNAMIQSQVRNAGILNQERQRQLAAANAAMAAGRKNQFIGATNMINPMASMAMQAFNMPKRRGDANIVDGFSPDPFSQGINDEFGYNLTNNFNIT